MAKASDNVFPKVITAVQATDITAPTDGSWKVYSKPGGIYARSSNTVVGPFAAASAATFSGCSVSGTSTAFSAGAYVSLAFDAADTYDTDSYHDPASNNTRLIAPTTAKYLLTATCNDWPASDTDRRLAYRISAGAEIILNRYYILDAGSRWYLNGSEVMALTASQYVEVRVYSSAGGATTTAYRAQLTRLG